MKTTKNHYERPNKYKSHHQNHYHKPLKTRAKLKQLKKSEKPFYKKKTHPKTPAKNTIKTTKNQEKQQQNTQKPRRFFHPSEPLARCHCPPGGRTTGARWSQWSCHRATSGDGGEAPVAKVGGFYSFFFKKISGGLVCRRVCQCFSLVLMVFYVGGWFLGAVFMTGFSFLLFNGCFWGWFSGGF